MGVVTTAEQPGRAWFRGVRSSRVAEYADLRKSAGPLGRGGFWVMVAEFDGPWHAWRFADVRESDDVVRTGPVWHGPQRRSWTSSMSRADYVGAVARTREEIAEGEIYQANICRVLSAPMPARPDPLGLAVRLARGNPAPYAALIDIPTAAAGPGDPGAWLVSASPELSLEVADGWVSSGPIKGTAATPSGLSEKDRAENVMITDLVRNDLQRVCVSGTVEVTELLAVEEHPGLVHLVSRVRGRLLDGDVPWADLLAAAHPPGSVSGAPKSAALRVIERLETAPRGPYCGQIGWIDADRGRARLAVGIRTFWWASGALRFGTGAGITWGSDPELEWQETELKAARLVSLASSGGSEEAG